MRARSLFRRFALLPLAALAIMTGGVAAAQTQDTDIRPLAERVVGDDLFEAFTGVTHDGAYNFDGVGEPRGRYRETHNPDGTVEYSDKRVSESGAWIIVDDMLCFTYQTMNGGCFRVWRVDNCYYYYSDAIPETPGEAGRDYWTARSVAEGETAGCEARFS